MTFSLIPMPDLIFVAFQPRTERKTASGLLIAPPKHEGLPNQGVVLAVGKNIEDVEVGDYVFYRSDSPEGFQWDGIKIIPLHKDDVLAVKERANS